MRKGDLARVTKAGVHPFSVGEQVRAVSDRYTSGNNFLFSNGEKEYILLQDEYEPLGCPDIPVDNPKDALGSKRLPLHLVPDTLLAHVATAYAEGAIKYGAFNWRDAGVRSSIYRSAAARHLAKWFNGEDADPETGVHHLASVASCCGILLDAMEADKLIDDRPPPVDMPGCIERATEVLHHLQTTLAPKES